MSNSKKKNVLKLTSDAWSLNHPMPHFSYDVFEWKEISREEKTAIIWQISREKTAVISIYGIIYRKLNKYPSSEYLFSEEGVWDVTLADCVLSVCLTRRCGVNRTLVVFSWRKVFGKNWSSGLVIWKTIGCISC